MAEPGAPEDLAHFRNRCYLVTGAARGIGLAIARRLRAAGAIVWGLDRDPCRTTEFSCLRCDLADEGQIEAAIARIAADTDRLHGLVNSAGILVPAEGPRAVRELSLAGWEEVLRINLTGTLLCIKHCHPLLRAAGDAAVVNLSSDQGREGQPGFAPYGVSKAGIDALTLIAARELAADRIRINALAPGPVATDFIRPLARGDEIPLAWATADRRLPFGIYRPDEVAGWALFLLSPAAARLSGTVIPLDSARLPPRAAAP